MVKDEIDHDHSTSSDDAISLDNTVTHDDTCVLKEVFGSFQVEFTKELQNVKDAFLER